MLAQRVVNQLQAVFLLGRPHVLCREAQDGQVLLTWELCGLHGWWGLSSGQPRIWVLGPHVPLGQEAGEGGSPLVPL